MSDMSEYGFTKKELIEKVREIIDQYDDDDIIHSYVFCSSSLGKREESTKVYGGSGGDRCQNLGLLERLKLNLLEISSGDASDGDNSLSLLKRLFGGGK